MLSRLHPSPICIAASLHPDPAGCHPHDWRGWHTYNVTACVLDANYSSGTLSEFLIGDDTDSRIVRLQPFCVHALIPCRQPFNQCLINDDQITNAHAPAQVKIWWQRSTLAQDLTDYTADHTLPWVRSLICIRCPLS